MSAISPHDAGRRFGIAAPGADHPLAHGPIPAGPERPTGPAASPRRRAIRGLIYAVTAVSLVLGGVEMGRFSSEQPATTSVLLTSRAMAAGTKLTPADLRTVVIETDDERAPGQLLRPTELSTVVGLVTRSALPGGSMLTRAELSDVGAVPGPDQALVGLALKPGQTPTDGLRVGDRVGIIDVPAQSPGAGGGSGVGHPVPIGSAPVFAVGTGTSDTSAVTVLVPIGIAALLAGEASRGEISLIRLDPHNRWPAPEGRT